MKIRYTEEQTKQLLIKYKTIYIAAKEEKCSEGTIRLYLKKYRLVAPPGFYSKGKKVGRQKGCKWTENQRVIMSEKFKGENNPFYGKKHDEITRNKMSGPRPSIQGENNPFKKACIKNPELIEIASQRKILEWSKIDFDKRRSRFAYNNVIGDISKGHWSHIKHGAKVRNLEFNITLEYVWDLWLKQDGKCFLSGRQLNLKSCYEITASLDRIDSSKGYIEGNVQWLHKVINITKMSLSNEDFISLCKEVVNNAITKFD